MTNSTQIAEAIVTFDPVLNKFVCTIDGASIGASVHKDYFEYHYRRMDSAAMNKLTIGKFVHIEADGTKVEVPAVRKVPRGTKVTVEAIVPVVKKDACTHCGSEAFKKNGKDRHGVQMYKCSNTGCRKGFKLAA